MQDKIYLAWDILDSLVQVFLLLYVIRINNLIKYKEELEHEPMVG